MLNERTRDLPLDQKPTQAEIDDVLRYLRLAPELQNVVRRMVHDANGLAAENAQLRESHRGPAYRIAELEAENAKLQAGYSPACEGCKQHSGSTGVHWCDECVSALKQAVHTAQCEAARDFGANVSLRQDNARMREAFDRYSKGEIRVEYGRHDVTQKAAYWGFDVRFWNGVTIPRQAVGPYAEPLEAALAAIEQETKP